MPTRSTFPFQSGESMKHPLMLVPVVLLAAGLSAAQGGVGNLKQKITKVPVKNEQVHVSKGNPGDKVSLNPQPLPPKVGNNGNAIRSTKVSNVSKSKTQKVGQGVTGGLKNAGS